MSFDMSSKHLSGEKAQANDFVGNQVEVSSDFDYRTTSYNGFIFASSRFKKRNFINFNPMGRVDMANSSASGLVLELANILSIKPPSPIGER